MAKIDGIQWQQTCCAWHGEYAEVKTQDGGAARIMSMATSSCASGLTTGRSTWMATACPIT